MENILNQSTISRSISLNRKMAWALLFLLMCAALAVVLTPAWLIQPFRPQSSRSLEVSYTLRRWSPILTIIFSIAAIALVLWLWRGSRRWWRKTALVLVLLLTFTATWLARQNHFEWMFNPLHNTAFVKTNEANFLTDSDMVMAVRIGNEAVAYPIRQMAYHHVVQDTVGGTPVVATY